MKFSPGTQFFDVDGVPVSLDASGTPLAWDVPTGRNFSYETLIDKGRRVNEEEFRKWVKLKTHKAPEPAPRVEEFPAGSKFFDVDGVPVTLDGHGRVKVWDPAVTTRYSLGTVHRDGKPVSQEQFRALLARTKP